MNECKIKYMKNIFYAILLSVICTGNIFASDYFLGLSTTAGTTSTTFTEALRAYAGSAVASGTVNSIVAYATGATGNIQVAIYSNSTTANTPGNLLGNSVSTTLGEGWTHVPLISPVSVSSGTVY